MSDPLAPGARVDVGIPTYGTPAYLRETMASVRDQTFGAWRLRVSENGPGSEPVAAIVEPFLTDPRVSYVTPGSNVGPARNATNALAGGTAPYVALLHDDDRWEPGFLSRRVAFLDAHPTCGMVCSDCSFVDPAGAELFRIEAGLQEGVQPRAAFLRALYRSNFISIPTVVMTRAAYEAVGGAFNHEILFYDHDMWLRVAARFDVGYLAVCDAAYRVHPTQTTSGESKRLGRRRLELLDAIEPLMPGELSGRERRRARSVAHLQTSAEALRARQRREAAGELWRGLAAYPAAPVDPDMYRSTLGSLRRRSRQRDVWSKS